MNEQFEIDDTPSLDDHPMAVFAAGESYESPGDRAWAKWVKKAERLLGHDLDGNQDTEGYSLDSAYAAFEAGEAAKTYVDEVNADPKYVPGIIKQ